MYRPEGSFNVPMLLLIPTYTESKGVSKKSYPDPSSLGKEFDIRGNFKTFGGTERVVNDVLVVENTAVVETWWRPDIKADCAVYLRENGAIYEIMGDPEDIDMRHQLMRFKVKKIKGGA